MAAPSRERCLLLLALDKEKMGRQCGSGCCFTDASAGRKIPFCLWKKSEMLDLEASLSISHYPNHFVSYPKYLSSQICKGEAMHLPSVKAGSNRQLAYLKSVFIYCLSSGVAARSKSRCSSFYPIVSRSDTIGLHCSGRLTARGDDMHAKDGSEASVGSCRLAAKTGALCPRGRRAQP